MKVAIIRDYVCQSLFPNTRIMKIHLYFYLQVSCSWTGVRIYMSVWIIIRYCDTHKKLVFLESQLESLADTFYDWDFTTFLIRKDFSFFFVMCSIFVHLSLPLYVARLIQQNFFLNSRFTRCCWVIHLKKSWWFILVVSKSFDDRVSCRIIIVSFCKAISPSWERDIHWFSYRRWATCT